MAQAAPDPSIPASSSTVEVRIIDTTCYGSVNTSLVFDPSLPGHETFRFPSYAFLITNPRLNKHVLFDLGMAKNWTTSLPPTSVEFIQRHMPFTVERNVQDILDADISPFGVKAGDISSVIWSHHHFDHRGDMSTFPPSTELVIGPGFQGAYAPYYPTDPTSSINEHELQGRPVRELAESAFALRAGLFPAHDFFGDGSLYILSAPGHTVGHLCALARLTSAPKPTFAFLGGDCAHHPGIFRPSPYLPLPCHLPYLPNPSTHQPSSSPGQPVDPFFRAQTGVNADQRLAEQSVRAMQEFDAREDVLVCISHDASLLDIGVEFYPATLNNWKALEKDGRLNTDRVKWSFCRDFNASEGSKAQH